jgi:hypothetical protein
MFFYIGNNCPINSLKQVSPNLFLDDGWNWLDGVWYKGYSTECKLSEALADIIGGYKPAGKWCVIHDAMIYHPVLRGFPIYELGDSKTNLKLDGYNPAVYTDVLPNLGTELTLDEVSTMIGDILVENTENFYKFNKPGSITALFSAGLDTLTAWTIIDSITKEYTLSLHVPSGNETEWLQWLGTEREYESDLIDKVSTDYWGYHHACFYKKENWNITGYYAEVYTYRDGEAINAIANYYGKRIDELASESDYLYWFLKRPNIIEKYRDSMLEFSDDADLKRFLWNTIWYDHQMWHLDNNLMFSPFADIRIPELVNRMSVRDIAHNCVTGQIQRNIIRRFRPDLLPLVADYKNEKGIWINFRKNFDSDKLVHSNTKIIHR